MGFFSGNNSMPKSISRSGGIPCKSSQKTSGNPSLQRLTQIEGLRTQDP